MSKESLIERVLCSEARVESQKLRSGFLETRDWINITKAAGRIAEAPMWIDDSGSPSLMEIRAKCRRWRSDSSVFRRGLEQHGLVVIDYLQLVHGSRRVASRIASVRSARSLVVSKRWPKS
jgi:replicative DNA helicase